MPPTILLLSLSAFLALLCAAALHLATVNQRLLRAQRMRAAERADLDRLALTGRRGGSQSP